MKLIQDCTCSICKKPLKWWNSQSCIRCHTAICQKHTCTIRRSRSSVLFSFCPDCALEAAKLRAMFRRSRPATARVPQKSLSGTSFSGFSFSGFSFSGFSFSGFSFSGFSFSATMQEKLQSDNQIMANDDTEQTQSDEISSHQTEKVLEELSIDQ
jgi:hypothetical protein